MSQAGRLTALAIPHAAISGQAAAILVCVLLIVSVSGRVSAQPPSRKDPPAIRILVVKTESEAREAQAKFNRGERFDRIVQDRSLGPKREHGGYLGRVDLDSLSPAARDAILAARPGRLTSIFPTEGGYGVIQILTEREAQEEEARLAKEPEALQALKDGTELGRGGDLEGAVKLLQRAVDLNPALADAHFNLGIALARLGRWDPAIAEVREVVRLHPEDFEAHERLGDWLSIQGRQAEAISHFERAASLAVESQGLWRKLAVAYETAGRVKAAVGAYRRALGLVGRDEPALLDALLRVAMAAGDGPSAVDAARRLRPLRPGHEGLLALGDALTLNGEAEAAASEYRKAVALAPASARAQASLAESLSRIGDVEGAAEHWLQAIRIEPSALEYYGALSALYERTGRLDLAIVALRDGVLVADGAPRTVQADIADRLAGLYDRADMRREAARERARAAGLRAP